MVQIVNKRPLGGISECEYGVWCCSCGHLVAVCLFIYLVSLVKQINSLFRPSNCLYNVMDAVNFFFSLVVQIWYLVE